MIFLEKLCTFSGEHYSLAHAWDELRLTRVCFPEASQIHLHGQVAPRCTVELVGYLISLP